MENNYLEALKFWNSAFKLDEDTKKQYQQELDPTKWKEIVSSEKLADILIKELSGRKHVLDYGCGEGWAGIALNKSGCSDVTAVDVVENAIKMAEFLKTLFKIESGLQFKCVSDKWLESVKEGSFDGIFCSNVIDVLPADVAESILLNLSKAASDGAKVLISMNYYAKPVSRPERGIEIRGGNEMYVNGILRMVTRTDEEWTKILGKYFTVEKIEYFAWAGETEEKRRVFILKK